MLRSRRKPRPRVGQSDPQAAILDAAERLCGERGIEAVSLRDIAKAAGVNLSALNYYFGSRTNPAGDHPADALSRAGPGAATAAGGAAQRNPPELRDIVRAVLLPLARWRQPGSNRNAALQFISRALTTACRS